MAPNGSRTLSQLSFTKPLQPNETLAILVGHTPLPRAQIFKKVWAYIKEHRLQDLGDRRLINVDERLASLFDDRKQINMFEVPKLLNRHLSDL